MIDRVLKGLGLMRAAFPQPVPDREHLYSVRSDEEKSQRSQADFEATVQAYALSPWVYRAVGVIADNVASVSLKVQVGGEPSPDHPLARLLQMVNEGWTQEDLLRALVISHKLAGESFLYLEGGGQPAALWWMRPDRLRVIPEPGQAAWYGRVKGYLYDDQVHDPIPLETEEVLHTRYFNPTNPHRGLSPFGALRQALIVDIYAQTYNKAFFRNSGRLDAVLEADEALDDGTYDRLLAQWGDSHSGPDKAHKVGLLEGVTYKPISVPPKDAEWLSQRRLSREEICTTLGVPPILVGAWEAANYATALEAKRSFWEETVLPEIGFICSSLTEALGRRWAPNVSVVPDLSGVTALSDSIHQKAETAALLFGLSVPLNVINGLLELGLPELEGGDVGYLPIALVEATRESGGNGSQRAMVQELGAVLAQALETRRPLQIQEPKAQTQGVEYGSQRHEALWRSFMSTVEPREAAMIRWLKKDFQEQDLSIRRLLRDQEVLDLEPVGLYMLDEQERWIERFTPFVSETVEEAGARALRDLGIMLPEPRKGLEIEGVWDTERPEVLEFIRGKVFQFSKYVNQETLEKLRGELLEGDEAGESILELMERVGSVFDMAIDWRAERIARTEVVGASNGGAYIAYGQNGIRQKAWLAAIDNRTRDSHIQAHSDYADTPIPMDESFTVGGARLQYPGDPAGPPEEIINCRCTILPIVPRE